MNRGFGFTALLTFDSVWGVIQAHLFSSSTRDQACRRSSRNELMMILQICPFNLLFKTCPLSLMTRPRSSVRELLTRIAWFGTSKGPNLARDEYRITVLVHVPSTRGAMFASPGPFWPNRSSYAAAGGIFQKSAIAF